MNQGLQFFIEPISGVDMSPKYTAAPDGGLELSGNAFSIKREGVTLDMLSAEVRQVMDIHAEIGEF